VLGRVEESIGSGFGGELFEKSGVVVGRSRTSPGST
jgi:hypothetical protein